MKLKKMLALLLALMLAFALVACGDTADAGDDTADDPQVEDTGDTAGTDDTGDTGSDAGVGTPLESMTFVKVPDGIVGSSWEFCGGFVNGAEMDNDQATATLQQYGGQLQIDFKDEASVDFVQGGGTLSGTCGADENNDMVVIALDNNGTTIEYTCLFADLNGTTILVMLADNSANNAFYFRAIEG